MSGTSATARQWQRVDCHVPVQLQVRLGPETDSSAPKTVQAQAVNLSERGMQLRTRDALRVGDDVTCALFVDGERKALPGRVRWAKPTVPGLGAPGAGSGEGTGAGIEFEGLSDDDSGVLRRLVTSGGRAEQPVDLYFAELAHPVAARAFTSDAGIHISAALPVLTRDSEVEFQFAGHGPRFLARIAAVAVRERSRTPHLEVELALTAREMPRFRRYTMYGAEDSPAADSASRPQVRPRAPTLQLWHADDQARTAEDAPGEASGAAQPARAAEQSEAPGWRPEPPAPSERRALLARAAILLAGMLIGASLAWLTLGTGAATRRAPRAPRRPLPAQQLASARASTPPHAAMFAPNTVADVAPAATPNATPPPTAAALEPKPEQPAAAAEPALTVSGTAADLVLPMSGTAAEARTTLWASPRALIIDLPHARIELPRRYYALGNGGARKLALQSDADATQVRVYLDVAITRYSLHEEGNWLRLHFERAAQPAAAP